MNGFSLFFTDSGDMEAEMNILYCTDFSENASRAFDEAVDAAVHHPGSSLHLLCVIPEPDSQFWRSYIYEVEINVDEKAQKDLNEKVDREYRTRVPAEVPFKVAFRTGRDFNEILKYADEIKAGLIVIGRQGQSSGLSSLLFGNVAERVVSKANCPVLVVPAQEKRA